MPIVRYFVVVGSLLLSLLFVADYLAPSAAQSSTAADVDRSIIRISSNRPLPDKIVLDVAQPPAKAAALNVDAAPEEPSQHDALAMILPEPPVETRQARAAAKHVASRRHTARAPRNSPKITERRLAFEHRDMFAGW